MTHPLNIIFDDFSTRLLGYRIEFSCLYLPQGHNFISNVLPWNTDECVFVLFERKSIFNCIFKGGEANTCEEFLITKWVFF